VSAAPHIITVSKEDFEKLKIQLEQSQRNNTEIQKELQTTQQRALFQDIHLKREITQLTQKEQHALPRVQVAQLEMENKTGELQVLEYEN